MMPDYKQMYLHLMGAISDALELLEAANPEGAHQILINAQLWAEDVYISAEDEE